MKIKVHVEMHIEDIVDMKKWAHHVYWKIIVTDVSTGDIIKVHKRKITGKSPMAIGNQIADMYVKKGYYIYDVTYEGMEFI